METSSVQSFVTPRSIDVGVENKNERVSIEMNRTRSIRIDSQSPDLAAAEEDSAGAAEEDGSGYESGGYTLRDRERYPFGSILFPTPINRTQRMTKLASVKMRLMLLSRL